MSSFFKGVALFVAVTCVVWIAVLWRWEATARDMDTPDIVVYLGLLPLTVFALALLLRWAWRGAAERQAAAVPVAAASGAPTAAAAPNSDEARRHATVQLLAAHLACAVAVAPAELLAAAKEGKPRPALDHELRDDDGLPVFAARIADLDTEASAALLEASLVTARAQRPEWAGLSMPSHAERALAALQPVLADTASALEPWQARFAPPPNPGANDGPQRRVRVLLGVPEGWSEFEQAVAQAFAAAVLADQPGAPIPPARYALTTLAGSGEALLLQADRLMQTLARDGRDDPVLLAACHSAISPEAIEALERAGVLFNGARQPRGRMPGEAAAALLMVGAEWPPEPTPESPPPPHLQRPSLMARDKPVDAAGRVDSATLVLALEQALATGRLPAEAITSLVCDADQHTARSAELHGGTQSLLPQLDSAEDLRLLTTVTGAVGAVGPLLVLACAAAQAQATQKPCLALTCSDPLARLALVAWPGPPLPATAPAPVPGAAS